MVNCWPFPIFFLDINQNRKSECCSLNQDSGGMLSLLGIIDQCLKTGKKQPWHSASVTNICAGLLAGLKVPFLFRSLVIYCKQQH